MPPPTPADLQGFWEMVYLQVENVESLFADLDKMRADGWKVKLSNRLIENTSLFILITFDLL